MNDNEKEFMKKLRDAEWRVPLGYYMEIDHMKNGWFVMKNSGIYGEPIKKVLPDPIITDEEAKAKGVDVTKCLLKYGCPAYNVA